MKRSLMFVPVLAVAWALALGACGGKSLTGQECGNGLIEGSEICDGTAIGGQDCTDHGFTGGILACESDCGGFDLTLCGDFVCGNGVVEPGESCEATDLDGQTCTSQGFSGGTLACAGNCSFDTSNCAQPGCGDGVVSGTEVCDGTNLDGQDCASQGFNGGTLACAASCGAFDTSACTDWLCGNGTVEGPEVCDGANVGTMTCTDFGFNGGTLACTSDCLGYDRAGCTGAGCGNGIREPGEVCDLTELGGITCADFGFDSGTLVCSLLCDDFDDSGCFNAVCGDGTADGAEICDTSDLRGATCGSIAQGFVGGTLACDGSCAYDTTGCTLAPPPGDDCANAGVIPGSGLPVSLTGDTSGMTDDYGTGAGDCPGMANPEGTTHPDVTYEFTPAVDGLYRFTFTPANFDGAIYIVTDCADIGNTCVGGSESGNMPNDLEVLDASLTGGTTYFVIVDGGAGGGGPVGGPYTLNVDGPLVDPSTLPGNDCSNPIVVPSTPYTDQGTTVGHTNDYTGGAGCPGLTQIEGEASADVVYEFTPTVTDAYRIEYIPTFDGALYVVTDCADVNGTCIGGSEAASFNPPWNEVVDATLVAGTTYYIIVDGGFAGQEGPYSLSIGPPCAPDCTGVQCGPDGCGGSCGACTGGDVCDDTLGQCLDPAQVPGEDCSNPVVVDPGNLPFVYLEDTTGSTDTANHSAGVCPGENGSHGTGAGDHTFELSPTVTGDYELRLTTYGWNGALYVVTDCADIDGSCVYSQEDVGGSGTETMSLTLDDSSTYYIIVDGAGFSGDEGAYQLFVGQPCVPQCAGLQCGDNGCGGSCGTCAGGEYCDGAGQCQTTPGDTCAAPVMVTAVPYTASYDTSGLADDYASIPGACPGPGYANGVGSGDQVFEFTPATSTDYTITVTPSPAWDVAFYIITDCADVANTCVEAVDGPGNGGAETTTVALTAGTTYYIVVDGWGTVPPLEEGPFTIEIQ